MNPCQTILVVEHPGLPGPHPPDRPAQPGSLPASQEWSGPAGDDRDGTSSSSQHHRVQSPADGRHLLDAVAAALAREGYAERDVFGMRLALDEALANAVRHGHRGDPTKRVEVRYRVTAAEALAEVEDQGEGFDPGQVPDPRAPENLERLGGRGLLLMRASLSWVRYNARGNVVTLCRRREPGPAGG
jgi:serine/threonine-protein kinase RsbW